MGAGRAGAGSGAGGDIEAFRSVGKRPSRQGGIHDPQFDALGPAPAVDAERARHVQRAAERLRQGAAKRLARRSGRPPADRRAVAAAQLDAYVAAAPDLPGLNDAMVAESEDRLGLAGTERSRPLDRADEARLRASGGEPGVDRQRVGL